VQGTAQGPLHRPGADDLELVVFSSGTTGSPKGIAHTYDGANASLANWVRTLGLTWRDVVFCPATFGHVGGAQWGLRTAVHLGAPLVLQDRWNPGQAAALIAEFGCTYTLVTPTFIVDLMRLPEECRRRMGSFRYWTVGGSGMSQPFIEAAERALPGIVLRGFGMSEHFMSTITRPDDPPIKRQTRDGRPLPGVEIQVWDGEGRQLPVGSPGEMVVRGPSSVGGYFTHPDETRATFVEGWQRTGDIVSLDEEGFIAVVDRKKEIIIRGGENISPQEIEQILGRHEDMPPLVVVGIPDERLGEKVGVVVEAPPEGCTLDACAQILADAHVARHKWPQVLIAVAELPRTSLGKIRRGSVRTAVRAGLANGELTVLGRTEQ
jgi:acyl-CoA synthetase (AMP-forming)/AMP-acid ligase II